MQFMILAVDAREFVPGRMTGIRRHLETLLANLAEQRPGWRILLFVNQHCEQPERWANAGYVCRNESVTWIWDQFTLNRLLTETRADLFYSPYYKVPLSAVCPVICTVHDIMEIVLPDYAAERGRLRTRLLKKRMALCLNSADIITCDSTFTRDEVVRVLRLGADKLKILPLDFTPSPPASQTQTAVLEKYGISCPYVLYVGNFKRHKNIQALLRAYERLLSGNAFPYGLVLAGGGGTDLSKLRQRIREISPRIAIADFVTEAELGLLYHGASALVLPSLYEGFGYASIEAMHHGVPMCLSRAASLPEVAGDAALYFDPRNPEEIARTLSNLLSDNPLKADLIAKGRERLKQYTSGKYCAEFVQLAEGLVQADQR